MGRVEIAAAVEIAVVLGMACFLVGKIATHRRRGIRAVTLAEGGVRRWLEPLLVAGLFLWLASILAHGALLLSGRPLPGPLASRLFPSGPEAASPSALSMTLGMATLGIVLGLTSLTLLAAGFLHMGRSWRIGIDRRSREVLVTHGVFSISRNPIFLALDLLALISVLISGAWYFLAAALCVILGIHAQIVREEAFLEERFGEAYGNYRRRVRRYLGWRGE